MKNYTMEVIGMEIELEVEREVTASGFTKAKRKVQMPCGNHTYKDVRFINPERRKSVKKYKQSEIERSFAESFRMSY